MNSVSLSNGKKTTYLYLNTLDIDIDPQYPARPSASKEFVEHLTEKIMKCPFLARIDVIPSLRKGYHIRLYCKKRCILCRLVYDDFERFRRDINRKSCFQNVLFENFKLVRVKIRADTRPND